MSKLVIEKSDKDFDIKMSHVFGEILLKLKTKQVGIKVYSTKTQVILDNNTSSMKKLKKK